MFYDTTFTGQNYNYFGYNKAAPTTLAYNYAALLQQQQHHQQHQQQPNMYHHMHPQYDEVFTSMRTPAYVSSQPAYQMDEFYQFNAANLARLKRYKQPVNTLDRNDHLSDYIKKYQKHLLKQHQQQVWKKATLESNYNELPSKSSKKAKSSKKKPKPTTYDDTYSKYSSHYELKSSLKTTPKTFKHSDDLLDISKHTPKSIRGNLSHLSASAHSSEASKSRFTESSNSSSSKSSEKLSSIPPPAPPPPPPAPPLTEDLFKPVDNSYLFARKKKIRKPLLMDADELASKSFDAVVDELKFKLEKLRTSDENLSRFDTLLNKTIPKDMREESPKLKLINYSDNFKHRDTGSCLLMENSSLTKSNKSMSVYSKKRFDSCSSSLDSMQDDNVSSVSKKANSVKFTTVNNASLNTTCMTTKSLDTEKRFKLEIYDSNGEESDDYTKYTRLKFTPTPKNDTAKFIDEKINFTPPSEAKPNSTIGKKLEFFTHNLFMINNHTTNAKSKSKQNTLDAAETRIEHYKNEFKETRGSLNLAPFIKIVKTTLTNQGDKSYASMADAQTKSETSSSGIDSANYLNSDDDLNQSTPARQVLRASSVENFLIPSKFSSFTDYNLTKRLNENKHQQQQKEILLKEEETNHIELEDEMPNYAKLNTNFEFNEYNKMCDRLNDFVSLQNNYLSAEFELSNDDNQMLNKYLNEMTSYYQNLNNQEFEHSNLIE